MKKIYDSAYELIGRTPMLRLHSIEKEYGLSAKIFAKLEMFNPAGSVKDRVALRMIEDAEKDGILKKGSVIIEPTSGNTGIGLASVAVQKGYRAIIVMPDTMSKERQLLMKAYGAELVLTDGALGMSGAIAKANEICASIEGGFVAGQFDNPSNPAAHFDTTGPEIYSDTDGKLDVFVAGIGTGGTLTGSAKYLKAQDPSIKIVGAEPLTSNVLSGGKAGKHGIQGIGAGFVPSVLDTEICDEIVCVSDEEALFFAQLVCKKEGILIGISGGCALCAAVKLAQREESAGKNIVTLFPDSGERYLSVKGFIE